MKDILTDAFDPEVFRKEGYSLIDMLADYLESSYGQSNKVATIPHPEEALINWRSKKIDNVMDYFQQLIDGSMHTHHPKYIGHQVSAPLPLTALAGLFSDLLNNGMGVYEMGVAGTAIEKVVIEEFCRHLGYDNNSDGILTSGGTLGNLTALLAARSRCRNQYADVDMYIITSEQAHYCAFRAASTMGFSYDQVIEIPTNENYQMSIPALHQAVESLLQQDKCVMAIVASSCSTSTGSYDDIERIAEISQKQKIWLHVDGAHGGAVIFSDTYRHLISGIEKADSVVIDAHKMMMTPALATAVLFKNGSDSYKTFAQKADYLFSKKDPEWFNLAKRTYETTKYMMSIKCFLIFRYYGFELIASFVDRQYNLTKKAADYIKSQPNWEIGHNPMSNILCFRYCPLNASKEDINKLNRAIRQRLVEEGEFYIVQTLLEGEVYLRITIMNYLTDMVTISDLLSNLEKIANEERIVLSGTLP